MWCVLQIGYFKAKQTFFSFAWGEVPDDLAFVLSRYFKDEPFEPQPVTKHEHYAQRALIAKLFGYRLWTSEFLEQLQQQAAQIVRRDVTPSFLVAELIAYLNLHKVERPGYTRLQRVIGEALSEERRRLADLLATHLDVPTTELLAQLLVRDDTLSELAALKQDAKDFGWRQMVREREKRATLEPLYRAAKALLPKLEISQQNLNHYASLANFYTIYDLRRMKADQANLYLLCYAWQRYRQLTDNLVDALGYYMKQLEDQTKAQADQQYFEEQVKRQKETPKVGRLLLLYVDDTVFDATPFADVRSRAYKIMPKEDLRATGQRLSTKPTSKLAMRWQAVDGVAGRIRRHLRPLCETLELSGTEAAGPWLAGLDWMKGVFERQQRLAQRPLSECPEATVPERLKPYLLTFDAQGKPTGVHADRYEFWVYRQLRKRLKSGEVYVDDSQQHRHLSVELVPQDKQAEALEQLDIPWVREPLDARLAALSTELREEWQAFDRELRTAS